MHFCVLVVGENVEEQMAPFQENNMMDCPNQYLKFYYKEEEYLEKYEKGSAEWILVKEGGQSVLRLPWDSRFQGSKKTYPEGSRTVEIPYKMLYPTFEDYMADWCGYSSRDPKTNCYGYWENPKAKWDYWRIGGRYRGGLPIKPGAGRLGDLSWEHTFDGRSHTDPPNRADQCYKRDLDLATFAEEEERVARDKWSLLDTPEFEEKVKSFVESARGLPRYEGMSEGELYEAGRTRQAMFDYGINLDRTPNLESYLKRQTTFLTFAVLHEGKWYEKDMSNLETENEWADWYREFLDKLPDDALLTVVDCHI